MKGEAFLCGDKAKYRRIDIAGSRSHHQSFERRHAHGRLDGLTGADGGGRASVSEVQADDVGLLPGEIANRAVAIRHVTVGDAVEAVPANAVAKIEVVRNRIQIRAF